MGTRAIIAKENYDKSVTAIGCQTGGFLSQTGTILHEHYIDPKKVNELIELGDIFAVLPEIGSKHDWFNQYTREETANWTRSYVRDRGQLDRIALTYKSLKDTVDAYPDILYFYFYINESWIYYDRHMKSDIDRAMRIANALRKHAAVDNLYGTV